MNKKLLIINADDFGYNLDVNKGIIDCFEIGCLTSATIMANMPAFDDAVNYSKNNKRLSVGLHLVLNTGKPVAGRNLVPDLIDEKSGCFENEDLVIQKARKCKLPFEQIKYEFSAQIEKLLDNGIVPSHIDGHQNIIQYPQPYWALMQLIDKYKIKKVRTAVSHYNYHNKLSIHKYINSKYISMRRIHKTMFYRVQRILLRRKGVMLPDYRLGLYNFVYPVDIDYSLKMFEEVLMALPIGVSELVCHPSFPFSSELEDASFTKKRVKEYELYSNSMTKDLANKSGVYLISYSEL